MLRLFDCLETDPNTLFQDSFRRGADVLTERERQLLEQYRSLSPLGRESVQTMVEALPGLSAGIRSPGAGAPGHSPVPDPCGGRLCGASVRRGFRLPPGHRRRASGRRVCCAYPGGLHGPLHPGRLRGLCESRSPEGRGRGGSSAWTGISSASSITRIPPERCIFSP